MTVSVTGNAIEGSILTATPLATNKSGSTSSRSSIAAHRIRQVDFSSGTTWKCRGCLRVRLPNATGDAIQRRGNRLKE
jgi:hypothetical protein